MSAYWQLIRPGLLSAVLFSMGIAALTAAPPPPMFQLAHAMLGTALLIAGATTMNQLMERRQDALMTRTASRPLPSGRLSMRQVAIFGVAASLAGIGWLTATEPPAVAILAAISWSIYVLLYTPLKRISVWHTPVGALAGAMPVLIGTATTDAIFTPVSLTLFSVIFFWQFPHTAAIGWIYRSQYASGQLKIAAVVDPSGRLAGWLAVFGAIGTLLASLFPATQFAVGWVYIMTALALGLVQAASAARFLAGPTDASARTLWWASLVYLPLLLTLLLVTG